jgi:gamma-glutamyltranspeptidase/glutathione hydrolase
MSRFHLLVFAALLASPPVGKSVSPTPVPGKHAMVVSAHKLASEVGIRIMKRGGNAVDAAVATGFALAVVFPEAGNLGGGGFMLVRKKDGDAGVIDFRETAPGRASRTMFLDSAGNPTDKSVNGCLSSGVPGTVAGLLKALRDFGTMPLSDVIKPAIDLARNGFAVDSHLERNVAEYSDLLKMFPSTVNIFFVNNRTVREGDTLRQPELAATLERIRDQGEAGFYRGETARMILEEMRRGQGLITAEDLEGYKAISREPLRGTYREFEVMSVPPPSSGGICLIGLLNVIEGSDLVARGYHSSRNVHLMTEAMKRVFADRSEYLGDPAFVVNPTTFLTSKAYARNRRMEIDSVKATPATIIKPGTFQVREGQNTTHFVTVDEHGNVASTTYTLNDLFGNKVVVTGAGFLLNDQMDDFSMKPGVPNLYGLVGGEANAITPGKRPLSSMCPTIILKGSKPFLVLGARGGSKIITSVFQTIVNVLEFGMNIQESVEAPRFHHQLVPDTLSYEKSCLSDSVILNLRENGYALRETTNALGEVEAVLIDAESGRLYGGTDPREGGAAASY